MLLQSIFLSVVTLVSMLLSPQDAEPILLSLDDVPTITYTESNLIVTTKSQELKFPVSTLVECTFSDKNVGIQDITTDKSTVKVNLVGRSVEISGLTANSSVNIYNVGGACVLHRQSGSDGTVHIDLSHLASGVYFLKSNQITYKFVLK